MDKSGTTLAKIPIGPKSFIGLTEDQKLNIGIDYQKIGDSQMNSGNFTIAKEHFIAASEIFLHLAKTSKSHGLVEKCKVLEVGGKWPSEDTKAKSTIAVLSKYNKEVTETITQSILAKSATVRWEELVGLEEVKKKIMETIVLPIQNPALFTGLLAPSKGILLFGPPGNGKTMVAKAVASQCENVTFFNLSAGTLTSKHYGDSEKLIQALFAIAASKQPSVIFIDEIDSILGARSSEEHEASRRIKTEFLVQFDGVGTNQSDRVVVIGATNRPFDLDEAVLRRFTARIFLPLPNVEARENMIVNQIRTVNYSLTRSEVNKIAKNMEGYSFADLKAVCQEAAMESIRGFGYEELTKMKKEKIPPVTYKHFVAALKKVPCSVSKKSIAEFEKWNKYNQK